MMRQASSTLKEEGNGDVYSIAGDKGLEKLYNRPSNLDVCLFAPFVLFGKKPKACYRLSKSSTTELHL